MSTTIESRDRMIDILSLSHLGDLLREQLGDDAENYTWPDDFEKAVADIDFKGLVAIGQASPYDTLICIGNGLAFLPRYQTNGAPNAFWNAVRFVANETLTEIPARSFERQTLLQSVVIPDSVASIGYSAFQGCTGLQSVVIPDSVANIGSYAFQGCTGLQSVVIPDSVVSIGIYAFDGCKGLQSVVIPDSVVSIGSSAFYGCTGLTSVRLPLAATYPSGSNAVFYGLNGLKTAGPEDSETDYAFKFATGTANIGSYAFQGCTGLQSVVIPDSVVSIGIYAFDGCKGLQSVVIPDSVVSIGSSAFYGCKGLQSVVIPDSVVSIGSSAFDGCTGLQSVVADGVVSMPNPGNATGRFANCTALHTLSLKKCAQILNNAGTVSNNYGTFSKCTSLATVQLGSVGYPLTEISNTAFFGCTNTSLVMTVYTDSLHLATVLANIRNGATNATIIIKAAADMEYSGVTYQAGDTVLTSTP